MLREMMPAVLSAILLILSFPPFNLEILAWFSLVPLFFAIENKKPIKAFLTAYLTGVIFFLGTIWWLIHVTLPGMIIVVLYEALFFGLFGLLSAIRYPLSAVNLLLFLPCAWVSLEWLRSIGPFGFGWALLGYSQYQTLPIIQISDITGAWGVSLLIVLVNTCLYHVMRTLRSGRGMSNKEKHMPILVTIAILFIALRYGYVRLNNIFVGEPFKISVIQGNIPQEKKWDPRHREAILKKYEGLTRAASLEKPDMIIWPEASLPGFLEEEELFLRVSSIAKDAGVPLLVGAPRVEGDSYYNSAILFSDEGRVISYYDKLHLVPFGEYVPFKKILAFVHKFAPVPIGDFTKGARPTVFSLEMRRSFRDDAAVMTLIKKVKFSALICFEDIFPGLVRTFAKEGASLLVNMTNDAWFLKTAAPYQHAQASVFRAVETRTCVVRAANTGLSCFIDQKGRIAAKVEAGGRDTFIEGFRTHEVVLSRAKTFYVKFGDLLAYLAIAVTLVFTRRKKDVV